MNKYSLLCCFICALLTNSLYSQISPGLPTLSPPSPNATSFHVYGNNQLKHYTGVADFQIPIFTIEQNGMSLPIYLQYTGGNGIQVAEIASWVGLGWTLNYGGAVSRVKKGLADEESGGGFLTLGDLPAKSDGMGPYTNICEGTRDGEPDNYSYNFPGGNGSFMFDLNGAINFKPLNNLDISYWIEDVSVEDEPLASNPVSLYHSVLGGFKIKNTDGTVHTFKEKEYSNSVPYGTPYSDNRAFPSTWYLSEMSNYNNSSKILFEYNAYKYDVSILSGSWDNQGEQEQYTLTTYLAKRINRISFANGFVDFVAGTVNRKDLNNERYLDKIIIRDKEENIIKQFQFSYQYSTGSGFLNDNSSLAVSTANRLILREVKEMDAGGLQVKPPYVFNYFDTKFLPDRNSKSIDHWGYFNGQQNNKFEPQYYFRWFKINEGWRTDLVGSANREANPEFSKAGILESVRYPTGGSTTFTYEGNTVSNYDFLPAEGQNDALINLSFQNSIQNIEIDQITSATTSPVEINYKSDTYTGTCHPKVYFKNTSTNNTYSVTYGDMSSDIQTTELPLGNYDVWFELLTDSGQYCTQEDPIIIEIRYTTISDNPDYTGYVGGLRLASAMDSDSEGNNYIKRYEYFKDDNKTTSGILVSNPVYGFVAYDRTSEPVYPSVTFRWTQSNYPLLTTQGAYVGYSKISETTGDTGVSLGKTEFYYTTAWAFPDIFHRTDGEDGDILDPYVDNGEGYTYLYPVADSDHKDFLRGKLVKKNIYENQSGNLMLKKRIENSYDNAYYDYKDPFTLIEYQNRRVNTKVSNGLKIYSEDCDSGSMYWTYYEVHTGYSLLEETKTTEYTDTGAVIAYRKNNYNKDASDFIDFYFPETEHTSTSTGESLIKTFKFPKDVVNPKVSETDLINNNRIVPIEINNYEDKNGDNLAETSELLSTIYYNYSQFGNGVTELNSIDIKKGSDSLEPRVRYRSYDKYGNPLEISREDGPPIAYIWGYDSQYPVAKVENATYADIDSLSYFGPGFSLGSGGLSSSQENSLRTGLPDAMVTTYKYEPMVGVISTTDPKGATAFYEYDTFNRLEFVKDKEGNLISENKYNYKGHSN